jgi:Tol biopolymer transport system component
MYRAAAFTALLVAISTSMAGCGSQSRAAAELQTIELKGVPSGPFASGRIAYVSDDGNGFLWTVAADGSHPRRITDRGGPNFPAWSPEGRRLAWECHHYSELSSLCVAASDGQGARTFDGTGATAYLLRPAWSPNGRMIEVDGGSIAVDGTVAQMCHGGCPAGVTLERDGTRRTLRPSPCSIDWPRFSPDGRRLAMVLDCGGMQTLVTVSRDGSHLHQVATRVLTFASRAYERHKTAPKGTGAGYFDHVSWSPDGRLVTFSAGGRTGWDVHVTRWDGRHDRRLTHDHRSYYPSFSPDGRMLVYQHWSGDSWDIWTMRTDGTHRRAIVTGAGNETKPTWCCVG